MVKNVKKKKLAFFSVKTRSRVLIGTLHVDSFARVDVCGTRA